jgi:hypothetical protein
MSDLATNEIAGFLIVALLLALGQCELSALHAAAAVLAPLKGRRIAPTCTCVHVPPRGIAQSTDLSPEVPESVG